MQTNFVCITAAASECLGPPPQTFEISGKPADKVCLDLCLANFIKNADTRAAKIVQNSDKPCLPKLQTKFVYCRQGWYILELALGARARTRIPAQVHIPHPKTAARPASDMHTKTRGMLGIHWRRPPHGQTPRGTKLRHAPGGPQRRKQLLVMQQAALSLVLRVLSLRHSALAPRLAVSRGYFFRRHY